MGPPKRMSDTLASSSLSIHPTSPLPPTTTPYSSSGPTLPLTSAPNEHRTKHPLPHHGQKRKRGTSPTRNDAEADAPAAHAPPSRPRTSGAKSNQNHPSLYAPWELLGARERKAVEARGDTRNVRVVVLSKNQNVRSGINALKLHLRAGDGKSGTSGSGARDTELPMAAAAAQEERIVAVSAQGEGTVKLVGIVDLVRRITGQTARKPADGEMGSEGVRWYMYTSLGSVVVPRKQRTEAAAAQPGEAGEDQAKDGVADADGGAAAVADVTGRAEGALMRTVPVLTVWMARKRIAEFRDAFGESEFMVYKDENQD